ncbi:hypothetical protein [Shewanella psychrophila]|uniref:hypothetical protein n=1 Tax=Shewanella psychrophila TaxID=225848 RepID=UPI0014757E60|nr:hypothetical protein [Shewanella psychrophila]
MKSQSLHGRTCGVSQKYLQINPLQVIDNNERTAFKHTTQYSFHEQLKQKM